MVKMMVKLEPRWGIRNGSSDHASRPLCRRETRNVSSAREAQQIRGISNHISIATLTRGNLM